MWRATASAASFLNTRWGGPSSPSAASASIHLLSGFIFISGADQHFIRPLLSTNTTGTVGALLLVQALRVQERACPAAEVVHRQVGPYTSHPARM